MNNFIFLKIDELGNRSVNTTRKCLTSRLESDRETLWQSAPGTVEAVAKKGGQVGICRQVRRAIEMDASAEALQDT